MQSLFDADNKGMINKWAKNLHEESTARVRRMDLSRLIIMQVIKALIILE